MSNSLQASRKGSNAGENMTSRSSSGFGDDSYSFRPDTAPGNPRERGLPVSPLALGERSKSVPINMRMSGRFTSTRPTSKEVSEPDDMDMLEAEKQRHKTADLMPEQGNSPIQQSQPWYMSMLREKEERLLQMGDEINRLSMLELELGRKDAVILELQKQLAVQEALKGPQEAERIATITDMKQRLGLLGDEIIRLAPFEDECKKNKELIASLLAQLSSPVGSEKELIKEENRSPAPSDNASSVSDHIQTPETKMKRKSTDATAYEEQVKSIQESLQTANTEVEALRERFDVLVPEKLTPEDEVILMREELIKKTRTISELEDKLYEAHKELSVNEGFISALHKDIELRENQIMKLTTRVEKAECKMKEATIEVKTMSKKFSDMREGRKLACMATAAEHELSQLKQDMRHAEEIITKMQEKIEKQNKDIRDSHRRVKKGNEIDKQQKLDIKSLNRELEDMKRKEQISRVSCEHVSARYERLRSRIVQSVFITPGAAHPNTVISDVVVFNAIKKIIDDRSEFHKLLEEKDPEFPPLQVELDATPEEEKPDDSAPSNLAPVPDRKSGKGGRKSPKHR